jgi:hypothetical protein
LLNLRTDLIGINRLLVATGDRNLIAKDTLVRATGVGQKNWDDERADAGFWMLDAGCWILDAGCWILDAGCWILDAGFWFLVIGFWYLVTGSWLLVTCYLSLITCHLSLVPGYLSLVTGCWSCEFGVLFVDQDVFSYSFFDVYQPCSPNARGYYNGYRFRSIDASICWAALSCRSSKSEVGS